MGGDGEPEDQTDIKSLLKRARELAADKPLGAWKLLYDSLPAVHEAVRAGRAKPTLLDAFLNDMADLSRKILPGELGKQFASKRQRSVWVEKTFEDMQEKLSDARKDSQPLRDALDAERQARERAETAASRAEDELKSLTQKLVAATGQAGEAQIDSRELKEAVKKAEAAAAMDRADARKAKADLRARMEEEAKLRAAAAEAQNRAEAATALLVDTQQELNRLRAKHDAMVAGIARGDLVPKETVETLMSEAKERALAERPVEVEEASASVRMRIDEANDALRETMENERALQDQVEILKKQLENQRPALEQYVAVCEALGLDPTKTGVLQNKVLGLLARSLAARGDEKQS